MASVNWKKMTRQAASAMKKHLGSVERTTVKHSNEEIDTSKSHLNFCLGASDYQQMYESMKARVQAVDKKHPPQRRRKDRIYCAMLEAPCPLEIQEQGRDREFFEELYKVYQSVFGAENVHGCVVHYDEQHTYADSVTGEDRTSMVHGHCLVSAYAKWEEKDKKTGEKIQREGINGKAFESKSALQKLNKAVCDMVRETFGIEYNTKEKPRKSTVERLKKRSRAVAQEIEKQNKAVEEQAENLRHFIHLVEAAEKEIREREEAVKEKSKQLDVIDNQYTEGLSRLAALREAIGSLQKEAARWQEAAESGQSAVESLQKEVIRLQKEAESLQEKVDWLRSDDAVIELERLFSFVDVAEKAGFADALWDAVNSQHSTGFDKIRQTPTKFDIGE